MDRPDPLAWIDEAAAAWAARGLTRKLRPVAREQTGTIVRGGRSLLNFASNDYLGLAADPRVIEAARQAASVHGWGAGASALVSGWSCLHHDLAARLAKFETTEAALLFPTGYAANVGAITAVVGRGDVVYSDRLNHACLIDGCRLSGATIRVYPHNDPATLDAMMTEDRGLFRRRLIATDGVFSMDGDLAPLVELANLADHHSAMLLVDEAHGTGVFGDDGRGAASERGVSDRVSIKVGTLSKALGSVGGFVAGSRRLIDWLTNHARTVIFSTAAPPPTVAAALESLTIVESEPERRARVRGHGQRLHDGLAALGFDVAATTGPIVPVRLGDPVRTVALADRLEAQGFLVPAIRPPTVPEGTSRLRISVSSAHSASDIEALILAFRESRS